MPMRNKTSTSVVRRRGGGRGQPGAGIARACTQGLHASRLAHDSVGLETALAATWSALANPRHCRNGGVLDMLCSEPAEVARERMLPEAARRALVELEPTHRVVAATLVQWLGTNVGRAFLVEAFASAGFELTYSRREAARPPHELSGVAP